MAPHYNKIDELLARMASVECKLDKMSKSLSNNEKRMTNIEYVTRLEMAEVAWRLQALGQTVTELQDFIWPITEKVFPNLLNEYDKVGRQFKGTDPAIKLRSPPRN